MSLIKSLESSGEEKEGFYSSVYMQDGTRGFISLIKTSKKFHSKFALVGVDSICLQGFANVHSRFLTVDFNPGEPKNCVFFGF